MFKINKAFTLFKERFLSKNYLVSNYYKSVNNVITNTRHPLWIKLNNLKELKDVYVEFETILNKVSAKQKSYFVYAKSAKQVVYNLFDIMGFTLSTDIVTTMYDFAKPVNNKDYLVLLSELGLTLPKIQNEGKLSLLNWALHCYQVAKTKDVKFSQFMKDILNTFRIEKTTVYSFKIITNHKGVKALYLNDSNEILDPNVCLFLEMNAYYHNFYIKEAAPVYFSIKDKKVIGVLVNKDYFHDDDLLSFAEDYFSKPFSYYGFINEGPVAIITNKSINYPVHCYMDSDNLVSPLDFSFKVKENNNEIALSY